MKNDRRNPSESDESRGPRPIPRQRPPGATKREGGSQLLRRQFREVMRSLSWRAPQPKPRRKRPEETRGAFRPAARQMILRPTIRIPAAAYRAVAFVSETLDWLNPWHHEEQEFEQEASTPTNHLSPHP